jgi:hypothetical protein
VARVALYEDGERLILHREGDQLAWVVSESFDRGFAQDAQELTADETKYWDSEVIDLSQLQSDRWPNSTGQAVAFWEDGRIWLADRFSSDGGVEPNEPGWRARHYIGLS